ncbi:MAG: hypothetical protein CMM25_02300 [Rhodospirillaceae bacterium]|nr:hypothetical protein [Rhodospirillaceae bacterium]
MQISRRGVVFSGAVASGGLAIAYGLSTRDDGDATLKFSGDKLDSVAIHAYIKIDKTGEITIAVPQGEMGQGVTTSVPMIIAEELDANWDNINYELAPLDKDYGTYVISELPTRVLMDPGIMADMARGVLSKIVPLLGLAVTGGSTTILGNYEPLRVVGAVVRDLLIRAAAEKMSVTPDELTTSNSRVIHKNSVRYINYGELAEAAAKLKPHSNVKTKDPLKYKLLGKPLKSIDSLQKVNGSAIYGIDVQLPGMLYASIRHSPVLGGKLSSYDDTEAVKTNGIYGVVSVFDNAVAVVANSTWNAQKGIDKTKVTWAAPSGVQYSSADETSSYLGMFDSTSNILHEDEAFQKNWDSAEVKLESVYQTPYLAHVCMEPMGCTALYEESLTDDPKDARITVWSPSQSSTFSGWNAGLVADVHDDNVIVHSTLMGGGFGRRADLDYVRESVAIAKQFPGQPIKLTWKREEDVQQDVYRPATAARFRAAIDKNKQLKALDIVLVGKSVRAGFGKRNGGFFGGGTDPSEDSSMLSPMLSPMNSHPYQFPPMRLSLNARRNPVPVGNWRSVALSHNGFYQEVFVDEIAEALELDLVEFRRILLVGKTDFLSVLEYAAEKGNWGKPLNVTEIGDRRGRGIAILEAFGSTICQVVEVTVSSENFVKVDRVVSVVDPHTVVNPNIIEAQIEGAVIDGLSSALYGIVDIENGQVVQSNFHDYRLMKMTDVPVIETYVKPQGGHPGGIGETGLPAIAPALSGAIYNAVGIRIRSLPVSLSKTLFV